jgi:hypothetical protein
MLKDEPKQSKFLYGPSVYEKIVPKNHFLRKLDACVDWKRIDALCHHLYCEDNGRPVTNSPRKMFKADRHIQLPFGTFLFPFGTFLLDQD